MWSIYRSASQKQRYGILYCLSRTIQTGNDFKSTCWQNPGASGIWLAQFLTDENNYVRKLCIKEGPLWSPRIAAAGPRCAQWSITGLTFLYTESIALWPISSVSHRPTGSPTLWGSVIFVYCRSLSFSVTAETLVAVLAVSPELKIRHLLRLNHVGVANNWWRIRWPAEAPVGYSILYSHRLLLMECSIFLLFRLYFVEHTSLPFQIIA